MHVFGCDFIRNYNGLFIGITSWGFDESEAKVEMDSEDYIPRISEGDDGFRYRIDEKKSIGLISLSI